MKWHHECSLGWLRARQGFLTATDVKDLLPVTKTGRKRTIDDESYIKVFARKLVYLTGQDRESFGVMARGHVLEPYAVEEFNTLSFHPHMFHWDDAIVSRKGAERFSLSFSPDAMDVNQSFFDGVVIEETDKIKTIGEVKSYAPDKHMACGYADAKTLEERWQLATAMAVCESIETAYLLFYNPSMRNQLYIVDYDRDDLKDEIKTVLEVEANWLDWLKNLSGADHALVIENDPMRELEIVDKIMKDEELNPEGKRTVTR